MLRSFKNELKIPLSIAKVNVIVKSVLASL